MDEKLPVDEFLETVTRDECQIGWRMEFSGDDVMHGARMLVEDEDRRVPVVYKTAELALDAAVAAAREHARCKTRPTTQDGCYIHGQIEDGRGGEMYARSGPPAALPAGKARELVLIKEVKRQDVTRQDRTGRDLTRQDLTRRWQ